MLKLQTGLNQNRLSFFCILLVFFFIQNSRAGECPRYISQLANPDIPGFGGISLEQPGPGGSLGANPLLDMANLMLRYVPKTILFKRVQVAIPARLSVNESQRQQFGDGQQNAFADYGPRSSPPFIALLERDSQRWSSTDSLTHEARLMIRLADDVRGTANQVEVSFPPGNGSSQFLAIDERGFVSINVSIAPLNWHVSNAALSVLFRPVGWSDWLQVQFPDPYVGIRDLFSEIHPSMLTLPGGEPVTDPLDLRTTITSASAPLDVARALQNSPKANQLGFKLVRVGADQRVHGIFQDSSGKEIVTSSGGVWTQFRDGDPFKIVYLVKDGRDQQREAIDTVVSGTGPHRIGATAEIILNSINDEPLMTFYGITSRNQGPGGEPIAWKEFSHQWVGTWQRPVEAFVTPAGDYHWHLNHADSEVAAVVLTPPQVPSPRNRFGFPWK